MKYKVTVQREDRCWYTVAYFDTMSEAVEYASSETSRTLLYHLVEAEDGGKH